LLLREFFLLTIANPEKSCAVQQQREFGIFEKKKKRKKSFYFLAKGRRASARGAKAPAHAKKRGPV
jgi:hypothetical protein